MKYIVYLGLIVLLGWIWMVWSWDFDRVSSTAKEELCSDFAREVQAFSFYREENTCFALVREVGVTTTGLPVVFDPWKSFLALSLPLASIMGLIVHMAKDYS